MILVVYKPIGDIEEAVNAACEKLKDDLGIDPNSIRVSNALPVGDPYLRAVVTIHYEKRLKV